jgi:nucleolar protein 15
MLILLLHSRVPHGFYEHQMKAYFSQFGDINRLRLSRNKKTGASRHFAFIEFASSEVADIVARTMNNYLMFGHILKVRKIPDEQVHQDLWKGAGKRFKVIPRAKLAARFLAQPKGRAYWRKKVEAEEERRKEKVETLKELGYDFNTPQVRKVEDVPMKWTGDVVNEIAKAVEEVEKVIDEPIKAIEPPSAVVLDPVENEVQSVIAKKGGKGKGNKFVGEAVKVKVKKAKKV